MKLLFKQRLFSWLDSYDIFDENGARVYQVKGQLAWGHCLKIFDTYGQEVGTVRERMLTFLPKFEMYLGTQYAGCIRKEFALVRPRYLIECNGWFVHGNWMAWDYTVHDASGALVATISKQLFQTDRYVRNRRGAPGGRADRADAGAGDRRRKVFPRQVTARFAFSAKIRAHGRANPVASPH